MGRVESEADGVAGRSGESPRESDARGSDPAKGHDDAEIRPMREQDLAGVARLHASLYENRDLQGHSLARLGPVFLEKYFYRPNLDNPYFSCEVALNGAQIVGFSVFSTRRQRVFRYPLFRHPVLSAVALLRSTLSGRSVGTLLHNLRYLFASEVQLPDDVTGWWIVSGVLPAYRGSRGDGPSIAARMFDAMMRKMKSEGCPAWYGAVRPDNEPINRFLLRRGGEVVATKQTQGLELVYYVAPVDAS